MSKSTKILLAVGAAGLIILISLLLVLHFKAIPTWQEKYNLGMRYLSEGNYQEAIVAFTAAIEIDPRRADAYVGRGDAHTMMARDLSHDITDPEQLGIDAVGAYKSAIRDYQAAIERDRTNADTYQKMAEDYMALGDSAAAAEILEQGFEATQDEDLRQFLDELSVTFAEGETRHESEQESQTTQDGIIQHDIAIDAYETFMREKGYENYTKDWDFYSVSEYAIIDIDSNNVPELILSGNNVGFCCNIVFYYDVNLREVFPVTILGNLENQVNPYTFLSYSSLEYSEEKQSLVFTQVRPYYINGIAIRNFYYYEFDGVALQPVMTVGTTHDEDNTIFYELKENTSSKVLLSQTEYNQYIYECSVINFQSLQTENDSTSDNQLNSGTGQFFPVQLNEDETQGVTELLFWVYGGEYDASAPNAASIAAACILFPPDNLYSHYWRDGFHTYNGSGPSDDPLSAFDMPEWGHYYYATFDGNRADWISQNIFNCVPEHPTTPPDDAFHPYYYFNGTYYVQWGDAGSMLPELSISQVITDGQFYYIEYSWIKTTWTEYGDIYTTYTEYSLLEPKTIDGEKYWSIHYLSASPLTNVSEYVNSRIASATNP